MPLDADEVTSRMTRPTTVRWRVLALIVLASSVSYVLRFNMSLAGQPIMKDLGLSELQFGLILSATGWGYGLFQLPGGLLGEFVGARRGLTIIMIAWGILTLLTGLVPGSILVPPLVSLLALIVLRFLLGAAEAPFYPVSSGLSVATWFPPSQWALPNGLGSTGLTLGAAAAGPGFVWLVAKLGWREAFVVCAPIAIVVAGFWWWYYRDEPGDHTSANQEELELIRAGRTALAADANDRTGWRRVIRSRDILLVTISYFCMNYVFYLFFNWFFYYLTVVRHLPDQVGGNFTGAQWLVGAVTATLGGIVCDRLTVRYGPRLGCRWTVMAGLLLSAPLLVAGALTEDPTMAIVLLCLSFGCAELTDGAFWAATMRMAGKHVAAATGVLNTGGNVVSGVGAVLVPMTAAAFGWVAAVSTGAVFAVIGALLWIWIKADQVIDV